MKKFFEEFKKFALKGNVMDMAIGVIIGGAFSTIVASLTEDIINPIIGLLFSVDFSQVNITLVEGVELRIGNFLSSVINFFLLALVLFCMLKAVNAVLPKEEPKPAAPVKSDETKALEEIIEILKEKK